METLMPWTQVARPGPDLSGQLGAGWRGVVPG